MGPLLVIVFLLVPVVEIYLIIQVGQLIGPFPTLALLIFESDVQSLGLQTAQGLVTTTAFYWDQNDETAPGPSASAPRRTSCPTTRRQASTAPRCTISRPCRPPAPTSPRP